MNAALFGAIPLLADMNQPMRSNYDKSPTLAVTANDADCAAGWDEIAAVLRDAIGQRSRCVVVIECYPGTDLDEMQRELLPRINANRCILAERALKEPEQLTALFQPYLGDDPVFGRMHAWTFKDFQSDRRIAALRTELQAIPEGLIVVLGPGAERIAAEWDLLVYADLARWEIQRRQRAHRIGNLGAGNAAASPAELYKRAYFIDWRAADSNRVGLFARIDYYLDTNLPNTPAMIRGEHYRSGLRMACSRPFRVVPFFDPGPWGGQWMRNHFDLSNAPPNFAWCFDCIPEENSLRLGFGSRSVESPALTLVHQYPRELLGEEIFRRFGAEFPIRFDFLDTMQGGNLSLQVHPTLACIRQQFAMTYTQDESYYLLDAAPDAVVYLGLKEGVDRRGMERDLRAAQAGDAPFPAEKYVNLWPVRKHSHLSIPAGTIHCSGANGMVLEISATPYIFTFKLWDWNRLGMDGKPRPIHLDHGLANIQWDRTTDWVRENLVSPVRPVAAGDGWREEATGLHALEFIETRRHWFTAPVEHHTHGNLHVLNLVEGNEAVVESPTGAFEPFVVHYAETFIVPASVGPYRISPRGSAGPEMATIKAYVREAHHDAQSSLSHSAD